MTTHTKSADENIIVELQARAKATGMSLWKVFKEAGQDEDVITRWKKKEPKALTVVREVTKKLAEIEARKRK